MVSLQNDVPNELLLIIAENLQEKELSIFSRTCKHFDLLLNPFLYRRSVQEQSSGTLYWACQRNQEAVVYKALRAGANINEKATRGPQDGYRSATPLVGAITKGHVNIVSILLEEGADATLGDYGDNPLENAIRVANPAIVKLLITTGKASLQAKNSIMGSSLSPLHAAIDYHKKVHYPEKQKNVLEIIQIMIDHGADIHQVDPHHGTPLQMASSKAVAKILVDAGAKVNVIANNINHTPLIDAIRSGDPEWVRMIINAGANVNAPNSYHKNRTPIFSCAISHTLSGRRFSLPSGVENPLEVCKVLIEHGADVRYLDREGSNCLVNVIKTGHLSTVKYLVKKGADPKAKNRQRLTPLHVAAEQGFEDIVAFLVSKGADVNATNYYRSTPLHRLCSVPRRQHNAQGACYEQSLRHLLKAGANINAVDRIGQTALMKAAYHGYQNLMKILMASPDIDIDAKDKKGKTAFQMNKELDMKYLRGEGSSNTSLVFDEAVSDLLNASQSLLDMGDSDIDADMDNDEYLSNTV